MNTSQLDSRIEEYWTWIALVLFLLITIDFLTTIYAAQTVSIVNETNPVTQYLLTQPISVLAAINIASAALIAVFFYAIVEMLKRTPPRYQPKFAKLIELWLVTLTIGGLLVFANNISVIILGGSLL